MNNKIKAMFTISLIVNIFLIGLVCGCVFKPRDIMLDTHGSRNAISPETRILMKGILKNNRDQMRASFKDIRLKKNNLASIFAAKEFDVQDYDRQVEDLLSLNSKILKNKFERFKKLGIKLPQDERKWLSKKLLPKNFSSVEKMRNYNNNSGN